MMGNTIAPVREWLANTVALTGMLVLFHSCLLEWILPKLYVRTKLVLFDWCCVTWEVEVTIRALERHEWFLFGCAGYLSGPAGILGGSVNMSSCHIQVHAFTPI